MTLPTPVRYDRLQAALVALLSPAVAPVRVSWAHQQQSMEGVPGTALVLLTLSQAIAPWVQSRSRGRALVPPASVDLRVTSATVGRRSVIRANGVEYLHDAVGGDTVDTVRDALVSAVEADGYATVSAAALAGAGEFRLTPDSTGALWSLRIGGAVESVAVVDDTDVISLTQTMGKGVVTVQAYSKGRNLFDGAPSILAQCSAATQQAGAAELLSRYGVGLIEKTPPLELSAIAGANWETRAAFDLGVSMAITTVEVVPTSDDITIDFQVETSTGVVASDQLTVEAP